MSDDDVYDYGEHYEHDMTVSEAVRLGLVAVYDSAFTYSIARANGEDLFDYRPICGHSDPGLDHTQLIDGDPWSNIVCTRAKGHSGDHAYIVKWGSKRSDSPPPPETPMQERWVQPSTPPQQARRSGARGNVVVNANMQAVANANMQSIAHGVDEVRSKMRERLDEKQFREMQRAAQKLADEYGVKPPPMNGPPPKRRKGHR